MEANRFMTSGCPKCNGALQEDRDHREWRCFNCGKTFPIYTESELRPDRTAIIKEGTHTNKEDRKIVESPTIRDKTKIMETYTVDMEDQGDDTEWNSLTKGGR